MTFFLFLYKTLLSIDYGYQTLQGDKIKGHLVMSLQSCLMVHLFIEF
jgi:hypothetical protein